MHFFLKLSEEFSDVNTLWRTGLSHDGIPAVWWFDVELPVCAFSLFIYVFDQVLFCYASYTVFFFSKQTREENNLWMSSVSEAKHTICSKLIQRVYAVVFTFILFETLNLCETWQYFT